MIGKDDLLEAHPRVLAGFVKWLNHAGFQGLLWWTAIECQRTKRTGEGREELWTLGMLMEAIGEKLREESGVDAETEKTTAAGQADTP